jgi:predicted trehalose synthase
MQFWHAHASAGFLAGYLPVLQPAGLLPSTEEGTAVLFEALLLDRALAEVALELSRDGGLAGVALQGVMEILEEK